MEVIHYRVDIARSRLRIHPLCRPSSYERTKSIVESMRTDLWMPNDEAITIVTNHTPQSPDEPIHGIVVNGVSRLNASKKRLESHIWAVLYVSSNPKLSNLFKLFMNRKVRATEPDGIYQRLRLLIGLIHENKADPLLPR